jgi:hypothetical protein
VLKSGSLQLIPPSSQKNSPEVDPWNTRIIGATKSVVTRIIKLEVAHFDNASSKKSFSLIPNQRE